MRHRTHVRQEDRRSIAVRGLPIVGGITQLFERLGESVQHQRSDFERLLMKAQCGGDLADRCALNRRLDGRSSAIVCAPYLIQRRNGFACCRNSPDRHSLKTIEINRRVRHRLFADIGKFADAGDAFLAPGDIFLARCECQIDLLGDPARRERREHATFAFDLLEDGPGLFGDLLRQLI